MANKFHVPDVLIRKDANTQKVENPWGVDATLYARDDVPIERDGVRQMLEFLSLQQTLHNITSAEEKGKIEPFWGETQGSLSKVVFTPDFHKGTQIPVGTVAQAQGFVLPQAVGNDICCGMRLLVTDLKRDDLEPHLNQLEPVLREIFFEGKRNLPMSPRQRQALLRDGLWGLLETCRDNQATGLWKEYDPSQQERELDHVHFQGVLPAQDCFLLDDYIQASGRKNGYDSQMGSIGGGNHFVEIQVLEEILDGSIAHLWGLQPDQIVIMIHTGSLGLGHQVGRFFREQARSIFPKGLARPSHGFYPLPTEGRHADLSRRYLDAMANAANFAFGNRLWLGLMASRALSLVTSKPVNPSLLYDVPHNLIWAPQKEHSGYLHRKGACPAYGIDSSLKNIFRYSGQPVLIPGSMGASSYILAGQGLKESLYSACHGAGRAVARGRSRQIAKKEYEASMAPLRVVTPIDPKAASIRGRRDILEKYHLHLKEEAPYAYKSVTAVVKTIEDAEIAKGVARVWPLLTVKG